MTNVILVIHILAAIILTTVVLMQRSEGGALGIGGGGGGGGGGLMSGQGVKGALVRTTVIFGAIFFVTSLTLTTMATRSAPEDSLGTVPATEIPVGSDVGGGIDPTAMGDLLEPSSDPLADADTAPATDPLADAPATTEPTDPLADPLADETPDTPQ